MGLACGGKTLKMKFGHHGGNHPVVDLKTKRVYITSQNHGFAVDAATLPEGVEASHKSLLTGRCRGCGLSTPRQSAFRVTLKQAPVRTILPPCLTALPNSCGAAADDGR